MQILNATYNLVFNTTHFRKHAENGDLSCKHKRIGTNSKRFFTEGHKDYMMLQTQGNHRFHAANAIEFNKNVQKEDVNTVEALANLGIGHSSQSLRNYKPNIHK